MDANDRGFTREAAVVSALAACAGLDDLAAKVRPSGRNPGRTAASDSGPGEPSGTPA